MKYISELFSKAVRGYYNLTHIKYQLPDVIETSAFSLPVEFMHSHMVDILVREAELQAKISRHDSDVLVRPKKPLGLRDPARDNDDKEGVHSEIAYSLVAQKLGDGERWHIYPKIGDKIQYQMSLLELGINYLDPFVKHEDDFSYGDEEYDHGYEEGYEDGYEDGLKKSSGMEFDDLPDYEDDDDDLKNSGEGWKQDTPKKPVSTYQEDRIYTDNQMLLLMLLYQQWGVNFHRDEKTPEIGTYDIVYEPKLYKYPGDTHIVNVLRHMDLAKHLQPDANYITYSAKQRLPVPRVL